MKRRDLLAATIVGLAARRAGARSSYPELPRRITMVVGIAAGSVTDSIARIVARRLAAETGASVVVENKPSAGQIIGIDIIKSRPADGTTLLFMAGSALGQAPAVQSDLTYQPLRDFSFIARTAVTVGAIASRLDLGASSVAGLIGLAAARPDELTYGSAGVMSAGHLQMEFLMRRAGVRMTHVPFKSDTQVVLELAEGRLDVAIVAATAARPLYHAGRLRLLAVTSRGRAALIPEVPALEDIGITGLFELDPFTFFGLVGPPGMDPALVRALNEAHNAALADSAAKATLRETLGTEPVAESPESFRAFVERELRKWSEVGQGLRLR